ncbi:helix-turn-helix domain-containing protein [Rhodococcus hoagii]|uniref:Helix-turn-helix domain-containing protein n=3 Tax=Rhodococcus hoagii TaxID=43767 RepID=A0AAE3BC13_RHOHA|nr:helix-turn-helix domain-containing protein [Prescottella equi]MBM4520874.1 helix-turn-helix domain-containing protein [Prescottella equi]MBM4532304.1 helix-turn-helix domain-containing protein [Prescottella equi]MBM4538075.1 helix-turn-helix domain-containing protein [Prescottella equi]MBM4574528.1 helix-turn-helix domain-containing protein [Prescottella equi]MBM4632318.1 helix-turn-helix domain-containing protein [Prescottella equi]
MRDRSAAGECAVDESADHGGEGFGVFDGEVVVVAEHQRYSYRAYPTAAQTLMLAKTFGCARVVFNDFVAHCRDAYETRGFVPDLDEVKSLVTAQAKHTPERHWLSEVSAVALQESARDAQAGYRAFVASVARTRRGPRVNPPRFKQKSGRQVATSVDGPKPLRIRTWTCRCGATLDRDYNAAVNVMLAAGLAERLNAHGGDVRRVLALAGPDEVGTRLADSRRSA